MNLRAAVRAWIDERLGWAELVGPLKKKTVPIHRLSYWYFLGGITLFLFGVQVCTGILLLLYYRPSASEAFASVQYIMTSVKFGWLVRSIHSWAANLMILTAFAHMFSVLFLGAYRKPRELTWVSGFLLLCIALAFGFSGYLLPWNSLSFFATKVGTEVAGQLPILGLPLLRFLRGGEEVTGATLTRFFGFHVALLPGIATLLLLVHLALVQRLGLSVPATVQKAWARQTGNDPHSAHAVLERPFFPNFLLREVMAWYIALGVLGVLAALSPWQLGVEADPFAPAPAGIKPEWYFLFVFQTLKLLPAKLGFIDGELLGIAGFGIAGLFLLLLPFLSQGPSARAGRLITGAGIFALLYMVGMTVYGFVAK